MPIDITQIKKVGKKVSYSGKKKIDKNKLVQMLKEKAYSKKELCEIFNVEQTRIYEVIKELSKVYNIKKALFNRRVYYWIEE